MRTLLVDNYDSFTYNLFHYLAQVNGEEPVVIRNDEPGWQPRWRHEFDNILVSPGPGAPWCPSDLGVCADLIDAADRPLLGVCLGHQAIAHRHGGTVSPAPQPMHGRLCAVSHGESELFAGMPSPLRVVRYHSLAVSELPPDLEPTAWTTDGVLMGLRHRRRPQWGVQFHPESICSQHGHRLLANFATLTRRWQRLTGTAPAARGRRRRSTPPPAVAGGLRVHVEKLPTRWVDEVVFDRLFRDQPHAFWLDSSRVDGDLGRVSIMGDASGPLARVATADVWTGTVTVAAGGSTQHVQGSFFDWLAADLDRTRIDAPRLPFGFALGWVGYLGYELKAECGGDRAHRSTEPDAALIFADRAVVIDHRTSATYLLALAGAADPRPAWLAETAGRLAALAGSQPDYRPPALAQPVSLRHSRAGYLELIASCQREIAAGETYEVNLTNMVETGPLDWWPSYQFLRRTSPAPFGALLRFGDLAVLSTSPERFLLIGADRTVESKPIKGTRPRGANAHEDELLCKDLVASEKDRAENLMIVDLVRNDLGRCAEIGSVRVDRLFDVETYATVHQLVSTISARLAPSCSVVDCVRAAFPGGSMTGAPKVRTMRLIDELEAGPRGVYSGAIGYFSLSGAAELSIVIRTAVVTPTRTRYGVGGAVVALSDPADEYEETAVKTAPLLRLVNADFPHRTP